MTTWKELKKGLNISSEDKNAIELEKDLIRAIIAARTEKGITQTQLAEMCSLKQSAIARIESYTHSPQVDSLLKILAPLGYKLQIVPIAENETDGSRQL